MRETAVSLRDVFCVHRTAEGDAAALQGANLELHRGEILALLGPSGAGKSTLLQIVAGTRLPSAGAACLLGRDIGRLKPRARARLRHESLGILEQSFATALSPDLPARGAVSLPLALRGSGRAERRARADELLRAAGLGELAGEVPGRLSGGERQRLALCASLAHRPAVLLADEPTGELDRTSAQTVLELIGALARSEGASVIIASHDPDVAAFADRTVTIRDGRIVEERVGNTTALVVGRGGSLALPARARERSGIQERAYPELSDRGVLLRGSRLERPRARTPLAERLKESQRPWESARVEVRTVTREYPHGAAQRRVLDGLSHAFAPGSLTVIHGRSGSGKTTLLRLLALLDRPDRGVVLIDNASTDGWGRERSAALRRRRIGYMSQEAAPIGFLSAQDNVALTLRLRGWPSDPAARRAARALEALGLGEQRLQRVSRFSVGEAQRVALARALAGAQGLLLVDEPTSHLDESNARRAAQLLRGAAHHDGQTVICATHDPALIDEADHEVAI